MSRFITLTFSLLQLYVLVQANGYYTIVSPGTIHPNSLYNIVVSVQHTAEPCKFKLDINGPNFERSRELIVQPMSVENVEFEIPDITSGIYKLTAEGLSGVIFTNSTTLNYNDKKAAVYVQTDKATYKPGDLVQFRIIFLDENIRPATIKKPINVFIKDAAGNRVKQFANITLTKGVFSENLQLSEFPLLGSWRIEAQVDGVTEATKSFDVDKYVLPKFEVTIDAPKRIAFDEEYIGFTIRSKYTFGKPVKGKAIVSIKTPRLIETPEMKEAILRSRGGQHIFIPFPNGIQYHTFEKTVEFNGKAYVEFRTKEVVPGGIRKAFHISNYETFTVDVSVEEELTGKKRNATTFIEVADHNFIINAPYGTIECDGLKKTANYSVTVTNLNGEPVFDDKNPVIFSLQHIDSPEDAKAFLNKNGIATVELNCNSSQLLIYVRYRGSANIGSLTTKIKPVEHNSVGLHVKTEKPKLGESIEIVFNPNDDTFNYFVYTIVARGNIIKSGFVNVAKGDSKTYTLNVEPTFEMIPTAKVYVHYIKGGDLKYTETTIEIEKQFLNNITIDAANQAKPGEDISIHVNTDPDSFVGLMGVDQSVLLLKSGNDFNKTAILNALDTLKTETPKEFLGTISPYPGSDSGVITMTNAHYPQEKKRTRIRWTPGAYFDEYTSYSSSSQMSGFAASADVKKVPIPPRIRKQFLENWFFDDFVSSDKNQLVVNKKVPDTITSWIITGFSLNPHTGFALTEIPTKIQTFRLFFIVTNLPYSIIRGEVLSIPVIVFNYMNKDLEAEITFANDENEFEFTDSTEDQSKRVKHATIPSNNGETINFTIRPKKIGHITLKITAISSVAGDAIEKKLRVEPEGVTVYKNRDYYLYTDEKSSEVVNTVKLDISDGVVPDSEHIEVSVMGDILGSTITNLDNLVRMPSGCGEQNMINFVPNILVLRYLESIQQLSSRIEVKAKRYLEIGYQRELSYKHNNGSYSAFGSSDVAGSTWLTAYVMRSFVQASKYTDIDPKILNEGFAFLASIQAENGSFPENGKVLDFSHFNDVGLTAFVLLSFLESDEYLEKYHNVIDGGFKYLRENVDNTDDLYALSIAAYALQLHKDPIVMEVLSKLDVHAKIDGGLKWWTKKSSEVRKDQAWRPKSHDVEVTGYIFMTLLDMNKPVLPITKWLISQRNSNGGFSSTQETVVGLQALIKFAEKSKAGGSNFEIEISSDNNSQLNKFTVDKTNYMTVQSLELQKQTREIAFKGKGSGTAIVQISYQYNIAEKDAEPRFKIAPKIKSAKPNGQLIMDVCVEYLSSESDEIKESNMVVMEVSLPSGYMADSESFDNIKNVENIKRVETKDGETKIIVYFDSLKVSENKCIPLEAQHVYAVDNQKPSPVVVYDYYDSEKRATEFYNLEYILVVVESV